VGVHFKSFQQLNFLQSLSLPVAMKQNKSVGCRFHTYDYARHFVSACTRILGLEGTPEGVEDQGKLTRVAAVCLLVPKKSSSWP